MFTKLMESYPEFSGCGGTLAAFVTRTGKSLEKGSLCGVTDVDFCIIVSLDDIKHRITVVTISFYPMRNL